MSKYDAKIECIVNRAFLNSGVKYEKGDIFPINPNNRIHKVYLASHRVYVLPEEHYEYICTKQIKKILGIEYNFNDIVDFSNTPEAQRMLYVKRGYVKKVIKKTENKEEEQISYSAYAKSKGMTYTELKILYKEKTDEYLPHHMSAISKEIFDKLEKIVPTKE